MSSDNPYQPPSSNVEAARSADASIAEAEDMRQQYISHENAVRSIGVLYYIVVFFAALVTIATGFGALERGSAEAAGMAVGFLLLTALYYWIGREIRRLNRTGRNVGGVFSALGLLQFPVGTFINSYILYLLFSAKGKVVFSDDYKQVIEATPHIKAKTSVLIWIILAILVIGIVAAIAIPAFMSVD